MATPNYGYNLPTVFGDDDAWGGLLNGNWTAIDTDLKAVSDQADAAVAGNIPVGGIIMWSGTLASIPSGWALCDGTNSTPDLRDRFIVGASDGADPGATGGANSLALTVENLPAHTHDASGLATAAAGDHGHGAGTLAAESGGQHSHLEGSHLADIDNAGSTARQAVSAPAQRPGSYGSGAARFATDASGAHPHTISGATANAGDHAHTVSGATGSTGGDQPFDNRPAFYALAFIMRSA